MDETTRTTRVSSLKKQKEADLFLFKLHSRMYASTGNKLCLLRMHGLLRSLTGIESELSKLCANSS